MTSWSHCSRCVFYISDAACCVPISGASVCCSGWRRFLEETWQGRLGLVRPAAWERGFLGTRAGVRLGRAAGAGGLTGAPGSSHVAGLCQASHLHVLVHPFNIDSAPSLCQHHFHFTVWWKRADGLPSCLSKVTLPYCMGEVSSVTFL